MAVYHVTTEAIVYNEGDWNDLSIETCERDGRKAPNPVKYQASKTLAEKGEAVSSIVLNGVK